GARPTLESRNAVWLRWGLPRLSGPSEEGAVLQNVIANDKVEDHERHSNESSDYEIGDANDDQTCDAFPGRGHAGIPRRDERDGVEARGRHDDVPDTDDDECQREPSGESEADADYNLDDPEDQPQD